MKGRIMIVEDEEPIQKHYIEELADEVCRVATVSKGFKTFD